MTVGLWAYSEDWSSAIDTQLFGNFTQNNGYGLFYNTGNSNELITLPTTNGLIYSLNQKGYKVFEKNLSSSTTLSSANIQYVVTDYFGARWLWDINSWKMIKLEMDDILTKSIQLPVNTEIEKIQFDSHNNLHILDTNTNNISSFDGIGSFISSTVLSYPNTDFVIDSSDTILYTTGRHSTIDKDGNIYHVKGWNIYKNTRTYTNFSSVKPI